MTLDTVSAQAGLYSALKPLDSGWSLRTHVVRLADGGLVLVSPTRGFDEATRAAIDALGPVRVLLAPSHFHYLGVPRYRERYPEATFVASDAARPRIASKIGLEAAPLGALAEQLPGHVTLLEPAGLKTGEVWLRAQTDAGTAWAVCDAFFYATGALSGMMGLALRMMKAAPGLCIGSTWGLLHQRDKRAYRTWLLDQLDADKPTTLLPAHGDPLHDPDLTERLRELIGRRL